MGDPFYCCTGSLPFLPQHLFPVFYEHHDAKAAVFNFEVSSFPSDPWVGIRAKADMVPSNNGNVFEVISHARFFYSGCENSSHGIISPSLIDPIILKAGGKTMVSLADKPNPFKPSSLIEIFPYPEGETSYKTCEEKCKADKIFVTIEIDLIQSDGMPLVVKSKGIPIGKDPKTGQVSFSKPDLIFDLVNNQVTTRGSRWRTDLGEEPYPKRFT